MKAVLTKIQILSLLMALPALANDVGLHNSSARPTRANTPNIKSEEKLKSQTVGVCQIVFNYDGMLDSDLTPLDPAGDAKNFLWKYEFKADGKSESEQDKIREILNPLEKNAQVTILKQPTHGTLIQDEPTYRFSPEQGYSGKDKAVFEVKLGDYKIRLNYYLGVGVGNPDDYTAVNNFCGVRGDMWKVVENFDNNPFTNDLNSPFFYRSTDPYSLGQPNLRGPALRAGNG